MRKYNSIFGVKEQQPTTKPTKTPKAKPTKKKKETKKEEPAPKKRGRPSNAELAAKAKEKRDTEIALRKQLIERQKAVTSGSVTTVEYNENDERVYPEYKTEFSTKIKDPNWVPPWPIFLPGQRVEYALKRGDGKPYKGTVGIDDIHSAFIRVSWDDGSSQFHAKQALKLIEKKTYKSLLKAKKKESNV